MSMPVTAGPPLAPVPDRLPGHTAYGLDGQGHQHGTGCHWDVLVCGWRCGPAAATPAEVPGGEVLDPGCPGVA